ncbi:hypothetical protein [Bacillus thuringiensis]|uniref:hypothetical protein n=1 Tax=Bacillus thuringiensis TaxID=1428 RepID=UPI000A373519|nr:hypothetical protein [Bacillus thuringiensis]OTZ47815.1 hypothetical protein BK762_19195 [Bacillus thuringiensis serovar toumanoffi]
MTKVHKVTLYITDHEEYDEEQVDTTIRSAMDRYFDCNPMVSPIESSPSFEWDDDLAINYTAATEENYENVMKGKIEYGRA